MSAVWLTLLTILCLSCTALSSPGSGVVWKDFGESVTIQCRYTLKTDFLYLKRGLAEDLVFFTEDISKKFTVAKEFAGRVQLNGVFPNLDILIKNLTSVDMGPYWCEYKRFNNKTLQAEIIKGTGSVLLVVTDRAEKCEPSDKNVSSVYVVIAVAVLLVIIILVGLFALIHKMKAVCINVTPVATSDVYEDMRGTVRRGCHPARGQT